MRTAVAVDIVVVASFGMSPKPKSVAKLHFFRFLSVDKVKKEWYIKYVKYDNILHEKRGFYNDFLSKKYGNSVLI